MRLEVKENTTSNNYELIFSEAPSKNLMKALKEIGFSKASFGGHVYTIDLFIVYLPFITSLQEVINADKDWNTVSTYPIFEPTEDSINKKLFTLVTILHRENDKIAYDDYIIFELHKNSISTLVKNFGKQKYGKQYQDIDISPKKLKRIARKLLGSKSIIDRSKVIISDANIPLDIKTEQSYEVEPISNVEITLANETETEPISNTEIVPTSKVKAENESSFIKNQLAIIISTIKKDELGVYDILSTIIDEIVKDLKEAELLSSDQLVKNSLIQSINKYKASLKDLQPFEREYVRGIMDQLLLLLDDTNEEHEIEKGALSLKRSIWVNDSLLENVLVPIHAQEPFVSGDVKEDYAEQIRMHFPEIRKITEDTLYEASTLELFYLAQLRHPPSFGIPIASEIIYDEWVRRGSDGFAELGFPTDLEYPYVNIGAGYFNIVPLRVFLIFRGSYNWAQVLLYARPLVDLEKALVHIDLTIEKLVTVLEEYADIALNKKDQDSNTRSAYHRLELDLNELKKSKYTIYKYLNDKNDTASILKDAKKNSDLKQEGTTNSELKLEILNPRVVANLETLRLVIADQKKRSQKSFLENEIDDTIKELENDLRRLDSPYGSIINSIIEELKKIRLFSTEEARKIGIKKISNKYTSWLVDSQANERDFLLGYLNYFLLLLDDTTLSLEKEKGVLSIKRIIWTHNFVIRNVLVPIHAEEPFASGAVTTNNDYKIRLFFKHLYKIKQENLHEVLSLDLFYLAQLADPTSFGITIESEAIEQEWEKRGAEGFEQLGFPTNMKYPYISLELGYIDIQPLEHFLLNSKTKNNSHSWWYAIRHARPIADIGRMIVNIDAFLNNTSNRKEECLEIGNEATKEQYAHLDCYRMLLTIKNIEYSKQVILDYLDSIEESDTTEVESEVSEITIKRELQHELQDVIGGLISIEDDLEGEQETIIATTIHDFEAVAEITNQTKFTDELQYSIEMFKNWVSDLEPTIRDQSARLINRLINHVGGRTIAILSEKSSLVIAKDIEQYDGIIENVLVPTHAKEPFQSGHILKEHLDCIQKEFSNLYLLNEHKLQDASIIELFQLVQLGHPKGFGIEIGRFPLLRELKNRGADGFDALGFPTDLKYPYVNIHVGYTSVEPLGKVIHTEEDRLEGARFWWWSALEHTRPVADLSKGISTIDNLLTEKITERQAFINPKTNRPKTKKEYKEAYHSLSFDIKKLEASKQTIINYLECTYEIEEESRDNSDTSDTKEDYIDRVIAIMHLSYAEAKRLTKTKIERLQEETGAPTLGDLWEAVELSWLLWYKMIYNEPTSFEARLSKMIHFWNKIQPTYAYSDSSKELYKQYSTPCPIGAIISQYTGMDNADSIFEPSAGNGLLLVGANPKITHVNEIDKSRTKSLTFQQFQKITTEDASKPFSIEMEKKYDVVVTNPPFASWDDTKHDKDIIIQKYFNNQRGLVRYMRLEHLMAGLALRSMKDNGRAAIITLGHIEFDQRGLFRNYRAFFNWLYRYYIVDDIINMNSFKLYNKQGAVTKTMLILIGGRKITASGVAPKKQKSPHLDQLINSFEDLWSRVQGHLPITIETIIKQLQIANKK